MDLKYYSGNPGDWVDLNSILSDILLEVDKAAEKGNLRLSGAEIQRLKNYNAYFEQLQSFSGKKVAFPQKFLRDRIVEDALDLKDVDGFLNAIKSSPDFSGLQLQSNPLMEL